MKKRKANKCNAAASGRKFLLAAVFYNMVCVRGISFIRRTATVVRMFSLKRFFIEPHFIHKKQSRQFVGSV